LLFGGRQLTAVGWGFEAKRDSFGALIKSLAFDVKGISSSPIASELAGIKGFEGKLNSLFVLM
jgi:hypothetical protein